MVFWIVITFVALAISGLLALILLRSHQNGEPPAAYDLRVYQQQLRDVEKDLARGVINPSDAERIRTEVSRRILAADAQLQSQTQGASQPLGLSRSTALISAVVIVSGTLGLYQILGAPGYGDMGLSTRIEASASYAQSRPSQAEAEEATPAAAKPQAEQSYLDLVAQLRKTAGERPDDAQGQALLAQHEANLGNFKAAYHAKQNYITIMSGDLEAQDYGELAELMIMATGGYVSPEAEEILNRVFAMDPSNGPARYYLGLLQGQLDRPDIAFRIWVDTLRAGPAGAPWIQGIEAQIENMALRAGIDYRPIAPPAAAASGLAGPSSEEVEAAQSLSAEERVAMIRNMVDGLSDRLANDGGTPPEWARLIKALTVLGERERAAAIYAEAKTRFAETPEALALIETTAAEAGLSE